MRRRRGGVAALGRRRGGIRRRVRALLVEALERRELLAGAPEIGVYAGAEEIADNRTAPAVDFGAVAQGWPGPTQTFTVRNVGTATLTLGTPQVPAGYTVTEPLMTSLAAGAWDMFTVQLNTVTVGTFAGEISFSTNDADEDPFNFAITGEVFSMQPAPGAT